jgi:hypothetical protein
VSRPFTGCSLKSRRHSLTTGCYAQRIATARTSTIAKDSECMCKSQRLDPLRTMVVGRTRALVVTVDEGGNSNAVRMLVNHTRAIS